MYSASGGAYRREWSISDGPKPANARRIENTPAPM
jgi:hypothetical protein